MFSLEYMVFQALQGAYSFLEFRWSIIYQKTKIIISNSKEIRHMHIKTVRNLALTQKTIDFHFF